MKNYLNRNFFICLTGGFYIGVADPDSLNLDPDLGFLVNPDPDPDPDFC